MATKITSHFSFDEFFYSHVAHLHDITNFPEPTELRREICSNIMYVAFMLELIRKQFGHPIKITSGFRCPELNKLVSGAPTSNHLKGLAVDIDCGKKLNKELYRIIDDLKSILPINELINEDDFSWIHVSFNKL